MSGQPITHTYLERIEQADVRDILDQIAEGYRISEIAPQIGVSRAFLSTYLNSTPDGRECLAVAREIAQRNRKHGHTSRWCAPIADKKCGELQGWLANRLSLPNTGGAAAMRRAPADHLATMQQLRAERATHDQRPPTPAAQGLPFTPATISAALIQMGPRTPDPG